MTATDQPIALVTGATRGLGFAMAEALAPSYHVIALGRTMGGLEDLDDRIKARGGSATLAPIDITQDDAMAHICRDIFDRWGRVDLWVHTAIQAAPLSPAGHIPPGDLDKALAVNVRATARGITMIEPLLKAAPNGRAVFFDDDKAATKFFGCYGATKAAQMAVVRSWQAETQRTGPQVIIETPPPMPTALRARFFPGEDREALTPVAQVAQQIAEGLQDI